MSFQINHFDVPVELLAKEVYESILAFTEIYKQRFELDPEFKGCIKQLKTKTCGKKVTTGNYCKKHEYKERKDIGLFYTYNSKYGVYTLKNSTLYCDIEWDIVGNIDLETGKVSELTEDNKLFCIQNKFSYK